MKPFLGVDITSNKKNEIQNGDEFIVKSVSKKVSEELESSWDELEKTLEESRLPLWVRIIKYICFFCGFCTLAGILRAATDIGLEKSFENAPYIFIICGVTLALAGILQIISKAKEKNVMKERNADQQIEDVKTDIQDVYDELNVPKDADSVDIIMFHYKDKNGEPTPKGIGLQTTPYVNFEFKIFQKEDVLCLASIESLYEIKFSELKAIKRVDKRISVSSWNKEEDPRKGKFKPYKMTVNDYGDVFFKPYYILEFERDGQLFGLYFPCYELSAFEYFTGLSAVEEKH